MGTLAAIRYHRSDELVVSDDKVGCIYMTQKGLSFSPCESAGGGHGAPRRPGSQGVPRRQQTSSHTRSVVRRVGRAGMGMGRGGVGARGPGSC